MIFSWITSQVLSCTRLIHSLPWNCSPHNSTTDSLSLLLQTIFSSFNFTSLSFLKLVNELPSESPLFLKWAAKIRTFFYPPNFSAIFLQNFSHLFFKRYRIRYISSGYHYRRLVTRWISADYTTYVLHFGEHEEGLTYWGIAIYGKQSLFCSFFQILSLILCSAIWNHNSYI